MPDQDDSVKRNKWLRLYRGIIESRVFNNADLLKVWIWCLCRANYRERWVPVTTGKGETEVQMQPGQFIFGRHSAATTLKMKPSSVWKRMKKLESIGNVTIQSNSHYSTVTIVNWPTYQYTYDEKEQAREQAGDNQVTAREQAGDTDKKYEKGKKGKKVKKGVVFPGELKTPAFAAAWREWEKYRTEIRHPLKPSTVEKQLEMLTGLGVDGAISAIHHTITMGWQGLRAPDGQQKTGFVIPKMDGREIK